MRAEPSPALGHARTREPLTDAASRAAAQVAAVRDDPQARYVLASASYRGPTGLAPHHLPFRRAAMSFMQWELRRGLLNPPDAAEPGSAWWRAMNERLIRDGCESVARAGGWPGPSSSPTIDLWGEFVARPTPATWYRAHNASIVAAYLEHVELAERENQVERFFLNVVLLRVLYAHSLVSAPRLALGHLAPLATLLGDPRLGMVGMFMSLSHVLPDRYPAPGRLADYLRDENGFGRVLDYAVIAPRLQALYDWSATELGHPGLRRLIDDGIPVYVWPVADRAVWEPARMPRYAAAMKWMTTPPRPASARRRARLTPSNRGSG